MSYIPFFIFKIFEFYKGFPKNIGFSKFLGSKSKNFEISRSPCCRACHFTSMLVFLCGLLKKSYFVEFLNTKPILDKIGVKGPHKNVNFSKNIRSISTKLGHQMSNRYRIRYTKFCVDICMGFGVILEKPGGADSVPPRAGRGLFHKIFSGCWNIPFKIKR